MCTKLSTCLCIRLYVNIHMYLFKGGCLRVEDLLEPQLAGLLEEGERS